MTSTSITLLRFTAPGLAIVAGLMVWLFVRSSGVVQSSQRRRSKRQAILLPVELDGMEGVRGLTHDLSLEGCRISGNLAVRRGQHLALWLHVPGEGSPIEVERARVRWTQKKDCGLQFMSLSSVGPVRLGELLRLLA